MLEMIDSADDVIALIVSDRIGGDELDAVMDRLDGAMARHDKVHVFVETRSIDGVEIAGLGAYMKRALPLLGKLDRFGRVAVVADQAWIRALTKIESAVLPHIGYRVFEPDARKEALDWVTGAA
ncbi:STAS/SEC14 domain-containing protein [Sphingopyxis sp. GW247-27LB]|uniref:STAS/SEC14 domain-containing protein n=1 Tax=Sphingopyxis sp. GW247-27LB TaxID=2012632 RepID=UPI000BA728F9|nr:STAS/SEC14 domain-containing protein [Sphingopyxis sp. GW247-27LB]PAL22349.1 STAS/SEC14 domain-containing protein [Sphingopyxis sp. GW247-27LB]